MPWTSEKTGLHTGHVEPLLQTADGLAPLPSRTALPWTALAAAAIRAGCSCGWTGDTVQPIDPELTVEETEAPLLHEWKRHAGFSALLPTISIVGTVTDLLEELTETDPRAALALAARLERHAKTAAAKAADRARAAGDSWADVGAAYGITKQAAHSRFGTKPSQ